MPGGRPPKAKDIIGRRPLLDDNGHDTGKTTPIRRIDQICDDLAIGMPIRRACKRAGIAEATFYLWEKTAGRALATLHNPDGNGTKDLTDDEKRCVEFLERVTAAELEWESRSNAALERLAAGGIIQVTETVKVQVIKGADGETEREEEIERTTRTTETLPDARVLMGRLKVRFPADYQERVIVAGTGEDGAIPVEHRVQSLADALAQFQAAE